MSIKRSMLGMIGVFAMMLVATFTTGSAQAAVLAKPNPGGRVLTAPAPPRTAQLTSAQALLLEHPTVTPAADSTDHVEPGVGYSCARGNLCTLVWDFVTDNWKLFRLFTCHTYALSNWLDQGAYYDNQTGGVTSIFYNQDGSERKRITPDATQHLYGWTPVWSIKNC